LKSYRSGYDPNGKGVVWDLDGVLLDSALYHRRAWERLAGELGVATTDEFFWEHFGQTNPVILPQLLGRKIIGAEMGRLSERKEELFREEALGMISLYPGVESLLQALKDEGWKMALGTSTPRSNVEFLFRELKLGRYLDAYSCGDDVSQGKPHPQVFLTAAERINLPPSHCVVVEDTPVGVLAARAAGMKCLAVATTRPATELLENTEADRVVAATGDITPGMILELLKG
jgi:HAD superfamily hydrolase (TIGR01509 family)